MDTGSGATGYWTLTDSLGSVRDVIDNSATVRDSIQYDAFGNINTTTELDSSYRGRYAYTGREFDVETGLQYNRARYYDATTGRWISQDPLGFDAGDSNLYRYVNNRPTEWTDPSGLEPIEQNGVFDGGKTTFKGDWMNGVLGVLTKDGKPNKDGINNYGILFYPEKQAGLKLLKVGPVTMNANDVQQARLSWMFGFDTSYRSNNRQ